MKSTHFIRPEIDVFYNSTSEENRLKLGLGPLEYERNQELIQHYLFQPESTIIDIGGGPGIYAEWLARLGHCVFLVDPVLKHIHQAKKRSCKLKNAFRCIHGESQQLALPDACADLIILHGPLYHLQEKQHRLNAIKEARRVLKPNGILLGFAINRTASMLIGLINGYLHQESFFEMCKSELQTGLHQPAKGWPGLLPCAYFHKPEELQQEFESCGIRSLDIFAVEGCVWLDKNYFESRSDNAKWQRLMHLIRLTEKESSLLGISPHLMIAGKKI